jgi:hypothetical protein
MAADPARSISQAGTACALSPCCAVPAALTGRQGQAAARPCRRAVRCQLASSLWLGRVVAAACFKSRQCASIAVSSLVTEAAARAAASQEQQQQQQQQRSSTAASSRLAAKQQKLHLRGAQVARGGGAALQVVAGTWRAAAAAARVGLQTECRLQAECECRGGLAARGGGSVCARCGWLPVLGGRAERGTARARCGARARAQGREDAVVGEG